MENLLEIEKSFHKNAQINFCDTIRHENNLKSFDYSCDLGDPYDHGSRKIWIEIDGHRFNDISIDQHNNVWGEFSKDFIPSKYIPLFAEVVSQLISPKFTKAFPKRSYIHVFVIYFQTLENRSKLTLEDMKFLFNKDIKDYRDTNFREWLIGDSASTGGNLKYNPSNFTKEQLQQL